MFYKINIYLETRNIFNLFSIVLKITFIYSTLFLIIIRIYIIIFLNNLQKISKNN